MTLKLTTDDCKLDCATQWKARLGLLLGSFLFACLRFFVYCIKLTILSRVACKRFLSACRLCVIDWV